MTTSMNEYYHCLKSLAIARYKQWKSDMVQETNLTMVIFPALTARKQIHYAISDTASCDNGHTSDDKTRVFTETPKLRTQLTSNDLHNPPG